MKSIKVFLPETKNDSLIKFHEYFLNRKMKLDKILQLSGYAAMWIDMGTMYPIYYYLEKSHVSVKKIPKLNGRCISLSPPEAEYLFSLWDTFFLEKIKITINKEIVFIPQLFGEYREFHWENGGGLNSDIEIGVNIRSIHKYGYGDPIPMLEDTEYDGEGYGEEEEEFL